VRAVLLSRTNGQHRDQTLAIKRRQSGG